MKVLSTKEINYLELFDWIMSDFKAHYSKLCYRQKEFEQVLARREEFKQIKDENEFADKLLEVLGLLRDNHIRIATKKDKRACKVNKDIKYNFSKNIYEKIFGKIGKEEQFLYKEIKPGTLYILAVDFRVLRNTVGQIEKLAEEIEKKKFNKIIIDLRANPGGNGFIANKFTGILIKENEKVAFRKTLYRVSPKDPTLFWAETDYIIGGAKQTFEEKIIVLSGQKTTSSAEGTILRLRSIGATVIGDVTYGNSAAPVTYTYGPIRVDIPSWVVEDLNGTAYGFKGIEPDIYIPPEESIINGEDKILEKALEL